MEQKDNFKIYSAPIQGLTELPWRHFHRTIYGDGVTGYFTPFLRVERGEVRRRDVRDLGNELNSVVNLTPQIIFRNIDEFRMLCDTIIAQGYKSIDLNMGCPFPPQVHHGRGAGIIGNRDVLQAARNEMEERYKDVTFSVKMRLGVDNSSEWEESFDILNSMPLKHITVHPRTAKEQYDGEIHNNEFLKILEASRHPVIYNGDITLPDHIDETIDRFAGIEGVMIGRGLFSRPSIVEEWRTGAEWDESRRRESLMRLHDAVYGYYVESLSGDAQVLGKVKPFWEYLAPQLDRKGVKAIKKATTLRKYEEAVRFLRNK